MANPSVTATITADDRASPALRQLVELTQRLDKTARAAFNESLGGRRYADSFRHANAAAMQHLTTMEKIHKVQTAIAASVAGVAGFKAAQIAKHAVLDYIPYERDVRYQKAIQGYSNADMALLEKQRLYAATVYGLKPEDTLHAQQAFVTRNFSAAITEAGTKQAIILSKALNVPAEQAAKIVEGMTFGQGIHLHSRADAAREIARSTDIAAIAAKSGSMTPEDISQFAKFGIGMSTAAGIKADQAFAAAMTLRRSNVTGDEAGVFLRQFSARLLAPTKQAFEAFAHMGIDYSQYAAQGNVSPDAIDASLRRRYGKGLSDAGKASLAAAFGDDSRNVLASREAFTAAVREAVEAGGEKLSRTDEKHLIATALRQYDLAKGGLNGGALFDAILSKASARDLTAILGDKQAGRGVMLLNALDQYREYLEKLGHGEGYASKIAEERMQGLAAAVDRLTGSLDIASKQMVAANQGWLTPLADAGAKLAGFAAGLSDAQKQTVSIAVGLASLSGLTAAGATIASVVASFGGLAASANLAATSLARIAAGGAVGAAGGMAGAATGAATGLTAGRIATGLGIASRALGWTGVAILGFEALTAISGAAPNPNADANYAKYLWDQDRNQAERRSKANALSDFANAWALPAPEAANRNARRSATSEYLRQLGVSDDGTGSRSGWQDSIRSVGPSFGFKDVAVNGTVTGSAELHQSLTVDVRPTSWFESVVKRAENVANVSLHGHLGTSMQGPGDNSTKASQSAAVAAP